MTRDDYFRYGTWAAMGAAGLTFIAAWIYCIATYGFLVGVSLGWIPAAICASIASAIFYYGWGLIAGAAVVATVMHLATTKVAEPTNADALAAVATDAAATDAAATATDAAATAADAAADAAATATATLLPRPFMAPMLRPTALPAAHQIAVGTTPDTSGPKTTASRTLANVAATASRSLRGARPMPRRPKRRRLASSCGCPPPAPIEWSKLTEN